MTTHGRDELLRDDKIVLRQSRAALMSDTKWRKLIGALDRPDLRLTQCVWKIIGRDDEVTGHLPKGASLYLSRPWIDTLDFGPMSLRSIEWLLLPSFSEPGHRRQDIEAAEQIISALGHYPLETEPRGVRVLGYLRSHSAR